MESAKQNIIEQAKKYSKILVGFVVGAVLVLSSYGYNDSGVSLRLQQPIIGYKWIKEEGFYFKLPFVSRTRAYNQKGTIASSDNESIVATASLSSAPRNLQFADSYELRIEWSMRYQIPPDDVGLEEMHKSIKSEDNLLGNTLMPFAQTLAADTAGQLNAGNFSQGGRNEYRSLMDNQSQFGMYETKVEKVKVVREQADTKNKRGTSTKVGNQFIRKVVYILDEQGKRKRKPLSITQYGVQIVPNSINLIKANPVGRLTQYIDNKQKNISLQIEQEENQKLLREKAKTAQLQGQTDLITKTNILNVKKQEAIIAAEQRVEEAKLQAQKETVERQKVADLAIIDKNRELQVSKANEGIQRANSVAAKYEASAIKEVGFAKAAVKKADYAAIDKGILTLEVDKAKALAMYKSNMIVNMPTVVSGQGGSSNSLETMTTLNVMKMLGKSATK
tara:strand:- start:2109 stop:3452 length:1344 start_codon:yes stop_codon:yes gene_type:complete